jgi:hypothetical protein
VLRTSGDDDPTGRRLSGDDDPTGRRLSGNDDPKGLRLSRDDETLILKFHNIKRFDDEKLPKNDKQKFYFCGDFDSHSPYSSMANHLRVATKAKNERVGLALHQFLKIIINNENRSELLTLGGFVLYDTMIENGKEVERKWSMVEIIDVLAKESFSFSKIHDLENDGLC